MDTDPNYSGIPKQYQSPSAQQYPPDPSPHVTIPPQDRKKGIPVPLFIIGIVITLIAGMLLATLYLSQKAAPPPEVKTVVTAPKPLIVGVDASSFPMEYGTKEGGVAGFDIDLTYRLANDLGATVEFKNLTRDALFTELRNKKIDMIISSITINHALKDYVFSEPYLSTGQVIISKEEKAIKTPEDIKDKKIGVQKGTTSEKEAAHHTKTELLTVYKNRAEAVQALVDDDVDALIMDGTIAEDAISQFDNLTISDPFTHETYGVVLRNEDTELAFKVNRALKTLDVQGILDDLKNKWLE